MLSSRFNKQRALGRGTTQYIIAVVLIVIAAATLAVFVGDDLRALFGTSPPEAAENTNDSGNEQPGD